MVCDLTERPHGTLGSLIAINLGAEWRIRNNATIRICATTPNRAYMVRPGRTARTEPLSARIYEFAMNTGGRAATESGLVAQMRTAPLLGIRYPQPIDGARIWQLTIADNSRLEPSH